ncbi:MAG TPA: hypothetical protein VJ750_09745 [Rhizomicrobium sp.]|nr:hypothetical protein [Rhizomicrobium sp.]
MKRLEKGGNQQTTAKRRAKSHRLRQFCDVAARDTSPLTAGKDHKIVGFSERTNTMPEIQGMADMTARGKSFFDFVQLSRRKSEFRARRHARKHLL